MVAMRSGDLSAVNSLAGFGKRDAGLLASSNLRWRPGMRSSVSHRELGSVLLTVLIVLASGLGLRPSAALALAPWQSREAQGTEKAGAAVIAFHGEPSRIRDSNLMKTLGMYDQLDAFSQYLWQASRMRGAVALPEDLETFMSPGPGSPPFDFYIEFQMKNDQQIEGIQEQLEKMRFEVVDDSDEEVTIYAPAFPEELYMAVTKSRLVVMGTTAMPYTAGKFPTLSAPAERVLKETQQNPAGLAIDFRGASGLIESGVEFGKENFPPPAGVYLDLLNQLTWGRAELRLVPKSEVLAVLECRDKESADIVKETIDGLVAMGKLNFNRNDPESQIAQKMLAGIKTEAEGKQVKINVLIPPAVLAQMRTQADDVKLMNDVKQASLAMHNYMSVHNRFPFATPPGESEDLSWMVRVLPYVEEFELYQQFDLTQGWDSPQNRKLLDKMPKVFGEGNETKLRWIQSEVAGFGDITDGSSNTIAFIHGGQPIPWTENKPMTIDEAKSLFRGLKPNEFLIVGRYDGSVQKLTKSEDMDEDEALEAFEALLTPAGGEVSNRRFGNN